MSNSNFISDNNAYGFNTVTTHLLLINIVCFLACFALERCNSGINLEYLGGLHYWKGSDFHIYQFLTYMFLHGGFGHIFFNMFALFSFGSVIERYWGAKFFLFFYLVTGIGAAVFQELAWMYDLRPFEAEVSQIINGGMEGGVNVGDRIVYGVDELYQWAHTEFYNRPITIGASGAVFGLLAAFAMLFPNQPMYLMFIPVPIKAKYMMLAYGFIELFLGVQSFSGDNVAHFAHLGGAVVGVVIVLLWLRKKGRDRIY